jgi:hypothetical protein
VSSRYTIRYRCRQGERVLALIVEDAQGRTYLFSGGALRSRAPGWRDSFGTTPAGHPSLRTPPTPWRTSAA